MMVELVGPPGSGKSTLARTIEKETSYQRIKIQSRLELVYFNGVFFVKHPIFCLLTFYLIIQNSSSFSLFYYKFMNIYMHHNARYEKAKKTKNALIDEGLVHNILGIFDKQASKKEVGKYVKKVPSVDLVLFFEASKETLQKRISARGYGARETLYSRQEQSEWLSSTLINAKTLREVFDDLGVTYKTVREKDSIDLHSLLR